MSSTDYQIGEPVITVQPSSPNTLSANVESKRKVSIVTDPTNDFRLGHDNLGYEQNSRRKTSQASDHSEIGPVRRKSILHNSGQDNESIHSHQSYFDRHNTPHKKTSTASEHNNHQYNNHHQQQKPVVQNEHLQTSWIYAFCMRCRVQYNTPSWEPPHWQRVCPYPLCPSFRQFARIISIILIGKYIKIK